MKDITLLTPLQKSILLVMLMEPEWEVEYSVNLCKVYTKGDDFTVDNTFEMSADVNFYTKDIYGAPHYAGFAWELMRWSQRQGEYFDRKGGEYIPDEADGLYQFSEIVGYAIDLESPLVEVQALYLNRILYLANKLGLLNQAYLSIVLPVEGNNG